MRRARKKERIFITFPSVRPIGDSATSHITYINWITSLATFPLLSNHQKTGVNGMRILFFEFAIVNRFL